MKLSVQYKNMDHPWCTKPTGKKLACEDFFSKCDQSRRKLGILSHLLKESLMENFIFREVISA